MAYSGAMSNRLNEQQLAEIRDVLQRDPPMSISDDDFDAAYEELSEHDPQLAAAWVMSIDAGEEDAPVREALPAERTARRAQWTARMNKATQTATTSPVGEEDSPTKTLPDQRRIMLVVFALLILVAVAIIVMPSLTGGLGEVPEVVAEEPAAPEPLPTVVADPLPSLVIEPPLPPLVVEEVEPAPATFTNTTPAPAPAPASPPAVLGEEPHLVLPVHTFVESDAVSAAALSTMIYEEPPLQGTSSGLNQMYVHVSDMGTGGPLNIGGVGGVASGLAPQGAAPTSLMIYEDPVSTFGGAGDAMVFTSPSGSSGDVVAYRRDDSFMGGSLFVHGDGGAAPDASYPLEPGSLLTQEYTLESMMGDASFDSSADALRAAGVPESALSSSAGAAGGPVNALRAADGGAAGASGSLEQPPAGRFDPLPTTQAEFDAFNPDEWLASSAGEDAAAVTAGDVQLSVGERIPARLVTSATILDGVPAPVIAETHGSWCTTGSCPNLTFIGMASLLGGNRVVINFHTLVTDTGVSEFAGIALSADYGTSIPAEIRDETPALAPDLVRASLGGVAAYANALMNQTSTTFLPDGTAIQESVVPGLDALIAGSAASALALPQSTSTVVRLAEIDPGVEVIVAVGLTY